MGPKNWKRIAERLDCRTDVQCLHRWQKVLNPEMIKGPWTEEEDRLLTSPTQLMYDTQEVNKIINNWDSEGESSSEKYSDEGHSTNTIYDEKVNVEINDDGTKILTTHLI